MNILVTGGSGFVGHELLPFLTDENVTSLARNFPKEDSRVNRLEFDLLDLLEGKSIPGQYDVVVHLAAKAHILNETSLDLENEFLNFNHDVTVELVKQMSKKGLRRFVFISSIAVNGAETVGDEVFSEVTAPNPASSYGKSKYAAEKALKKLSKELNFELVIIRPPLVYGNNAPGNFGKLVDLIAKKLPLPFGLVNNQKSYISVTNLADFIALCCKHDKAVGETFVIADDGYISLKILIKEIGKSLGVPIFMLPVPKFLLVLILKILGKGNISIKLLSDLRVDNTKAKTHLGWRPPLTTQNAIGFIRLFKKI